MQIIAIIIMAIAMGMSRAQYVMHQQEHFKQQQQQYEQWRDYQNR